MNNTFEQQIEAARQRLETLQQHAGGTSPDQTALAMEALEELSNALEELHVAGEELRQQNDELAASRQAMEAERRCYEELFEFAPDGYLETDPEGVIREANRAAAALLGVRQDFLMGKPLLVFVADVLAQAGHTAFHTRLTQLQQAHTDKLQDWEIWLQPREGKPCPVEVTLGRVCDANDRLTGLRWLLRDITERKQGEELLELEKVRLQAQLELHKLMDAPPDQLFDFVLEAITKTTTSQFAFIGLMDQAEAVMTIHAWSKGAMAQCAIETKPRHFPIAEAGLWGECVRQRQPVIVNAYAELKVPDKKGTPAGHVPIERFLAVPVFDGERIVVVAAVANKAGDYAESDSTALILLTDRLWGILRRQRAEEDIKRLNQALEGRVIERSAQLERANQGLRASEARYRIVADNTYDWEFWLDPEGQFIYSSPSCQRITGYAPDEYLRDAALLQRILHPQDAARFQRHRSEAERSVASDEIEFRIVRSDGTLAWIGHACQPLFDGEGRFVGTRGSNRDITARKRAEDEIKRRNQELATLNEIGRAITSTLDLDHVLPILLEHVRRVAGATTCAVGLIEAATGEVVFYSPLGTNTTAALIVQLRLNKGEGIAGWVIEQRRPALIADVSADPRARLEALKARGLTSMVSVPLIARDAVIGVLNLLDERAGAFAEQDVRLLESVAVQAAIAIQNARLYAAEQQARQIAEILCGASAALTQTLNLNTVLDALLDYVGRLVPYDSAAIVLLEGEARLAVRAERGYEHWTDPEQIRAMAFDARTNPIARVLIEERKSVLISDTREQPGWERRPGLEHIRSWLGVPLAVEGKVIGLCGLDKTEPGFFTQGQVQLAEALVGQAAVAVQNAWLFEQVRAGRERLQSLSHRLVQTQETERAYIARELHDVAGQCLTTLLVGLGLLKDEANQPEAIAAGADELSRMVEEVLEDLHRLAMDLRPASLDYLGLVTALRQHINAVSRKHGLMANFETAGLGDERLPQAVETNLYRIVQEALTNIVRYARATRVEVLLERRDDQVRVAVKDNGVGFDPSAARAQDGRLGLFGMQERAEMLGGTLAVESVTGVGTTITVEVPYDDTRAHYR